MPRTCTPSGTRTSCRCCCSTADHASSSTSSQKRRFLSPADPGDGGGGTGDGFRDVSCIPVEGNGISNEIDTARAGSRCSYRAVQEAVSSFGSLKRELVMSIGFEGILSLPSIKQLNRKFSVWLLSKVDDLSSSIVVREGVRIPFCKEDVGLVFGIPCAGRAVCQTKRKSMEVIDSIGKDYRSIKFVQDVVERDYGDVMVAEEQDAFKVSFVIFVMASLLAPGVKHDYAEANYWGALAEPSEIHMYDWGSYVLQGVMDASLRVKADLLRRKKVSNIRGCSLFLQVLYLDSLNLGRWDFKHDCFPRVKVFSSKRLRAMIAADSRNGGPGCNQLDYGISSLRELAGVCYSWASRSPIGSGDLPSGGEAVDVAYRHRNAPTEAIGMLTTSANAGSTFLREARDVLRLRAGPRDGADTEGNTGCGEACGGAQGLGTPSGREVGGMSACGVCGGDKVDFRSAKRVCQRGCGSRQSFVGGPGVPAPTLHCALVESCERLLAQGCAFNRFGSLRWSHFGKKGVMVGCDQCVKPCKVPWEIGLDRSWDHERTFARMQLVLSCKESYSCASGCQVVCALCAEACAGWGRKCFPAADRRYGLRYGYDDYSD